MNGTLPWQWWLDGASLHIRITDSQGSVEDRSRMLGNGAALHHLRTALCVFGWAAETVRFPDPRDLNYLAILHLTPGSATGEQIGMAAAIFQREFQHNRFRPWEMPPALIRSISRSAMGARAAARYVPNGLRRDLAGVYRAAADRHADYGEFLFGVAARMGERDLTTQRPDRLVESHQPDSGELLILCTATDDSNAHLDAGEAASAILLTAGSNGLVGALLTQTMTIPEVRSGLRTSLLRDCAHPHAIIRIGRPDTSATDGPYVQPLPGLTTAV